MPFQEHERSVGEEAMNKNEKKTEKLVDDIVAKRNSAALDTLREIVREKIVRKVKDTLGEDSQVAIHGDMSGLFGFYRGKVVKHCKDGFCKVFIPGIYPDEFENNPDALPDAEQASPLFGGGTQGNGMISIPDVNATVWCFFQNGD